MRWLCRGFRYELAPTVGQPRNETFRTIADNLVILLDNATQYHPEFQGYTRYGSFDIPFGPFFFLTLCPAIPHAALAV